MESSDRLGTSVQSLAAALMAISILRPPPASAGLLVDAGAGFRPASYGTTAFGDYDLDGDLDLLLTGLDDSGEFSRIYRNDGQAGWTDIGAGLVPVRSGAAAWGDYDGDRDLDLLLTGLDAGPSAVSRIYRNDGGTFMDSGTVLRGVHQSSTAWADIDNDGDLDAALMGSTTDGGGSVTRFYRNDAGQFVELDPPIPDLARGSLDFGDGDGDGDLDLVVTGVTTGCCTTHSEIYRNDGGQFTVLHAGLKNLFDGAARWGDYDLDGDLDVLENGSDSTGTEIFTKLYRNIGSNVFALVPVPIEGAGEGAALAWGDYDADGDPDFAAMAVGFNRTEVFKNDGGLSFPDAGEALTDGCCGSLAWGDVDGDRDLDFVVAVFQGATKLYRNDGTPHNTPPSAPTGLAAAVDAGGVTLSWFPAQDAATPSPGLTYNLHVGTSPGGSEVMPAMADPATGRRRIPAAGNASHRLSWRLGGLPDGTYFWSVQAVDPGFEGSPFASEQVFVIGEPTAVGGGTDGEEPGDASPGHSDRERPWLAVERDRPDGVAIRYGVPGARPFELSVLEVGGRRLRTLLEGTGPAQPQTLRWQPSGLASGVYFVQLASGGKWAAGRLVWMK